MTNEEAIKVLNDPTFTYYLWRVEQEEAIELATKALEQQKTAHQEYVEYGALPELKNYHCSLCRAIVDKIDNYCHRCGAKFDKTYAKTHLSSVYGKDRI